MHTGGKAPEKGRKEMQERQCRKDGAGETVEERQWRKDDAGKTVQAIRCSTPGKKEPPIPGTRTTASPKNHDFSGKTRLAPRQNPLVRIRMTTPAVRSRG